MQRRGVTLISLLLAVTLMLLLTWMLVSSYVGLDLLPTGSASDSSPMMDLLK